MTETRGTEWKVGLFMLIGIGLLGFMAITFGKLGQGLRRSQTIIAEFPNASGLLKGADVYLAGARVGYTGGAPELIEGRYAVRVQLKLRSGIKIPRGSSFFIGSSGFLGDAYVSINPPSNPKPDDVLKDGDYVIGTRLENLGDLTAKGGDVMEELKKRLQELEAPIKDINQRLLSDQNLTNLTQSFADFHEITAELKKASKGINEVVEKTKVAADTVTQTVNAAKTAIGKFDTAAQKVDVAAGDLKTTFADIRKAAGAAGKALESARSLLNNASSGRGALGMLMSDKEAGENLKIFIRNLKERGVLWYKDKPK